MMTLDYQALGLEIHAISGAEEIIVKCPYHEDSHPSASFNIVKGLFFCFACGAAANANQLARKTGGYVIRNDKMPKRMPKTAEPEWENWLSSPFAFDNEYLEQRGVTNTQVQKFNVIELPWGIGFPTSLSPKKRGLLIRRYEGTPRYVFFGEKPKLYAGQNWESKSFTVVEGIFGLLAADRAKVNSACTLGTAINLELTSRLRSYPNVQCLFDADFPGYLAAAKFIHVVPTAFAIVPGQEADELTVEEWQAIDRREVMRTSDFTQLKRLSKDPERFTRILNSYRKRKS